MKLLNILIFLLIFNTFILLGFLVSEFTGKAVYERFSVNITRVVDGDTIDTKIGKVRLLGINTPEKKQAFYNEAKDFLNLYEGKQAELESKEKDKYNRTLAYVYFNNKMINSEILRNGLANLYVYEKDEHYSKLKSAEEEARKKERGIWKKSRDFGCLDLIKLKYEEGGKRCTNQEQLIINNKCGKLNINLKDSANHIFNFQLNSGLFVQNFSCIFNDEGDSLFARDDSGLLLFYRY